MLSEALDVEMRFTIPLFLLMANFAHAEEVIMKCEGRNTFKYDGGQQLGDPYDRVFKYEETLLGNPIIKYREKGAWKPWCGEPKEGEVKSNTLTMGQRGGACFSIRESDKFYAEVTYVVDFILNTYSLKSDTFKNKETNEEWSAEADMDCRLLN